MTRSSTVENLSPRFVGQLSTTCSNATEVSQWAVPLAVDDSQLRTMASATVDQIDWPLPSTL